MKSKNTNAEFSAFITPAVKERIDWAIKDAARLVNLNNHDCEDLRQNILLAIYNSMGDWDSARGTRQTFASFVIKNTVRDFLKSLHAGKRRIVKLTLDIECPQPVEEPEYITYADLVPWSDSWDDLFGRMDADSLFEALPPFYSRIAKLIAAGYAMKEIAAIVGVSNGKFFGTVMPKFRRRCREFFGFSKKVWTKSAVNF